jgi:hypothetical protein
MRGHFNPLSFHPTLSHQGRGTLYSKSSFSIIQIKGWILPFGKYPAYLKHPLNVRALFFADSEHLGAAGRANTLRSRLAVLHGNAFCVTHFFLGAAFYTICLHVSSFPQSYLL